MAICVCGNINEDIIMGIGAFPAFHEKVRAETLYRGQGGSAANTAWWLASQGGTVRMIGCVGKDDAGDSAVRSLRDAGADTSCIRRSAEATGLAVVLSDGNDKRMVKFDGANRDLSIEEADLKGCRHLHLTSVRRDFAQKAIQMAKKAGSTVSWDPSELVHPNLLPHIDILFLNEDDYRRSGIDTAAPGMPVTVVTKNGGGCIIDGTIDVATIDTPVTDTTGAGDAFAAGFLHAWTSGHTLEQAGQRAVACSFFNIRTFGSREGFTSPADIDALMAQSY